MAARKLIGTVNCYWEKQTSNNHVCDDCDEVIYGDMWVLLYVFSQEGKEDSEQVSTCYCPSCYAEDDVIIEFEPWWGDKFSDN